MRRGKKTLLRRTLIKRRDGVRQHYIKKYSSLIKKQFRGENPRITNDYARFRQANPKRFDDYRTKKTRTGTSIIYGHNKKTGRWEVQSILIPRKK